MKKFSIMVDHTHLQASEFYLVQVFFRANRKWRLGAAAMVCQGQLDDIRQAFLGEAPGKYDDRFDCFFLGSGDAWDAARAFNTLHEEPLTEICWHYDGWTEWVYDQGYEPIKE